MDPTIHQNLVSMMGAIEAAAKDPDFRRASQPSPPFHSENVIFVTSHFSKTPNSYTIPLSRLSQLRSIGVALSRPPFLLPVIWLAFEFIREKKFNSSTSDCTIFVDEGIYVDTFDPFKLPDNCNVEIVGIRNVYLVLVEMRQIAIKGDKRIKFRNVTVLDLSYIFDRELPMDVGTNTPLFLAKDGAYVALEDVNISAPEKDAVVASGRKTRLVVSKSCVKNCAQACTVDNGARMTFEERCMFKSMLSHCADVNDDSSLTITDTFFDNCNEWAIMRGSKVELKRCSIIDQHKSQRVGIMVTTKSSLTVRDTRICLLGGAVDVSKGSALHLEKNHIKCLVAIQSKFTTLISAHDNVFATEYLINMSNNVKGSVEFKSNRMETGFETRYVLDAKSVKIDDDFDELQVGHEDLLVEKAPSYRKENKSSFRKKIKAEINANGMTQEVNRAVLCDERYKRCGWCNATEHLPINIDTKSKISKWKKEKECQLRKNSDEGARQEAGAHARPESSAEQNKIYEVHGPHEVNNAKFKYCSRCNKVSYCSKKCQENDWHDHKIICNKEERHIEEISLEFEALMKRYPKASRIE